MPRWEYCEACEKAYNPRDLTPEERLLQAIFGRKLCKECHDEAKYERCIDCKEMIMAPIHYNDKPYHPKCLAKKLDQIKHNIVHIP